MILHMGTGGFTLVELLVVLVIIGILAGIAAPCVLGYINAVDEMLDRVMLRSVYNACGCIAAECGAELENVILESENDDVSVGIVLCETSENSEIQGGVQVDVTDEVEAILGDISFSDTFDASEQSVTPEGVGVKRITEEMSDAERLECVSSVCDLIAEESGWAVESYVLIRENDNVSVIAKISKEMGDPSETESRDKDMTAAVETLIGDISFADTFERALWNRTLDRWILN